MNSHENDFYPAVTITAILRDGRRRWYWSVTAIRGGEAGECDTKAEAQLRTEDAKRRLGR